jgi:hypothetical protein
MATTLQQPSKLQLSKNKSVNFNKQPLQPTHVVAVVAVAEEDVRTTVDKATTMATTMPNIASANTSMTIIAGPVASTSLTPTQVKLAPAANQDMLLPLTTATPVEPTNTENPKWDCEVSGKRDNQRQCVIATLTL